MRLCLLALMAVLRLPAGEWLTFGADAQRTGHAKNETIISTANASKMKLLWSAKLPNQTKELTALTVPVITINHGTTKGFRDFAIIAGSSDTVFAIDADTGALIWKRQLEIQGTPKNAQGGWLCPNALNATPVIDRPSKTVYVLASDGRLHALNFINGEARRPPVQFTPPFGKTWSLNLHNGVLYVPTSQNCNGVRSAVYAFDLNDPNATVQSFLVSPTGGAGIWGRAGVAITSGGKVVGETGDGPWDVAAGKYSDTFVGLDAKTLQLIDYYTPSNRAWITKKDLDMGCMSAAAFKVGDRELVAGAGKEGVIYLLDAKQLGGDDHRTPLLRSPLYTNEDADFASRGFWGAMATAVDTQGQTWLYAPAWGDQTSKSPEFPTRHGETPNGSIMAFRVSIDAGQPKLTPVWRSRDLGVPEAPIVANGVVYALSSGENTRQVNDAGKLLTSNERATTPLKNAVLYALDAATGKELFSSGDSIKSFTHFSGLAISEGRVFVTTWDNTVYAFGLAIDRE